MYSRRNDRGDENAPLECLTDKSGAIAQADGFAFPKRSKRFMRGTGIDQRRASAFDQSIQIVAIREDRTHATQGACEAQHHVMNQNMQGCLLYTSSADSSSFIEGNRC